MVKLHPINGFAAETSSAAVIFTATQLGIPVSTTHDISAAIMGVGAAKRFNAHQMDRRGAHGLGLGADHPRQRRRLPTAGATVGRLGWQTIGIDESAVSARFDIALRHR